MAKWVTPLTSVFLPWPGLAASMRLMQRHRGHGQHEVEAHVEVHGHVLSHSVRGKSGSGSFGVPFTKRTLK